MVKKNNQPESILIANRAEVACRIIHATHELGLDSVLVASRQDAHGLAAQLAKKVLILEGDTLAQTYLNGDKIIELAQKEKCALLHPGFGFLSEDANFAQSVKKAGIQWIGPSPKSMLAVSDKFSAKKLAQKLKIPTNPWVFIEAKGNLSAKILKQIKQEVGFPCLVKAVSGGGGKGLKAVVSEKELPEAISSAQREAQNAFGDNRIFVEKLITHPRHIEIQIFGDNDGQIHVFGERDCSVQRRYQKIIEESPAPFFSPQERKQLEQYAKKIATAIHYRNAGTVEFLLDVKTKKIFFLEVNTRLQVEHAVTEERYGVDLVKMQILTALEKSIREWLPHDKPRNHVMELRLYAEDAGMNFLPQPGKIRFLQFPVLKGFRLESGIESGNEISGDYDPMIAKLIVTAINRKECFQKAVYVLQNTTILGPTTNRDFLISVLENAKFQKGGVSTQFLNEEFGPSSDSYSERDLALAIAKAISGNGQGHSRVVSSSKADTQPSLFQTLQFGRDVL